jgi:hypothetical protein
MNKVLFIQYHLPPLESGEYQVTVDHEVRLGGKEQIHETYRSVAKFAVASERFRIDPSEIDSVFPPSGGQGEYFNVLPHIVLSRRTMPWERSSYKVVNSPGDDGRPVLPWLALLLFDQNDPAPLPQDGTVADLLTAQHGGKLPDGVVSYPISKLEYGETLADACRYIDLPATLFRAVAPSREDLPWLAHARRVRSDGKSLTGVPTAPPQPETDYAAIIGNRVPVAGHKSTVHLVSLEAMEDYLPSANGTPSLNWPSTADRIRLLSLSSWSFDTIKETHTFASLLEGLYVGMLCLPDRGEKPAASEEERLIVHALEMGYTGMNHLMREGGQSVSWYRGPLVPFDIPRFVRTPIESSDAIMAYDPSSGLLDVSYASAWSLGRQLALQSRDYVVSLFAWKNETRRESIALAEAEILKQRLMPDSPSAPVTPMTARLAHETNREAVIGKLKAILSALSIPSGSSDAGAVQPITAPLARLRPSDLLRTADQIVQLHGDEFKVPGMITAWLARLRLLHGVPFPYLVPDEAMLPPESIRFFHLDWNWLDSLTDGAYSLGRTTAGDRAHDTARNTSLHHQAGKKLAMVRNSPDSVATDDGDSHAPQTITGFLLRSSVVSGWPGLEVSGYSHASGSRELLTILRFERLSPQVLLILFDGELDTAELHEPPEGLHFGLDMPDGPITPTAFFKKLRSASLDTAGDPLDAVVPVHYRTGINVICVSELANELALKVGASTPFTSAEFALEMIEGVALVRFITKPGGAV